MENLTITITDPLIIDGWIAAANNNGLTPEGIVSEFLTQQGKSYANLFQIGTITSAAFMARFTPAEFTAIMTAADTSPDVKVLVDTLTATPSVNFGDPRLLPGLEQLAAAGLIAEERIAELMTYERPEPEVTE